MKGTNVVTKPYPQDDGSLKVHSIWYTLQGEGPDSGRPAIFVRLSHCNLRCHFCDTQFDTGAVLSLHEVFTKVRDLSQQHRCKYVVITGGEPLLQNIVPFVKELNLIGISVGVETAGTVYVKNLEKVFHPKRYYHNNIIICSPKTPTLNADVIPLIGALKYIVRMGEVSTVDGLPIASTQIPGKGDTMIYRPCSGLWNGTPIYIQPMDEGEAVATRINMELAAKICMTYGYLLSIQTHKLAGVD